MKNIKAKIITVATMKGGTGKTTICFNIAGILAEKYKVLVIDLDQQCNLSANIGFDIFDRSASSVADLFDDASTDPVSITVVHPIPELPNLDVIPSTMFLNGTELRLVSVYMREQLLKSYIEKNAEFFNYYDYIMFDTPPNIGICTQNALHISDHIILVTDPDCNSARGTDVFLALWNEAIAMSGGENHIDALILNNMERTKMSAMTDEYIRNHEVFSHIKLNTMVPHSTRFKECAEQNKPISLIATKNKKDEQSRAKAEQAIRDVITELKERGIL